MAGSSTVVYDNGQDRTGLHGSIRKIVIDWVSDASDGTCTILLEKISGELIKGVTNPGATAPTASYDIVITDEESVDVLAACVAAGRLGDRHTSTSEQAYFFVEDFNTAPLAKGVHPVVCDKLTVAITNAGNSKVGRLVLYYRPN